MPELPDVESFKNYLDSTSLHQKIIGVTVKSKKILDGISAPKLTDLLEENSFQNTRRYGKHLLLEVSKDLWVTMHFGLTGSLKYFENAEDINRYTQVMFSFENGRHLAYISRRMLDRVGIAASPDEYIKKHGLGKDALEITEDQFKSVIIKKHHCQIGADGPVENSRNR